MHSVVLEGGVWCSFLEGKREKHDELGWGNGQDGLGDRRRGLIKKEWDAFRIFLKEIGGLSCPWTNEVSQQPIS